MVTFKAVVHSHQRRQDGSYNVKIRITQHRRSIYVPTSVTVRPADLTRSLNIKNPVAAARAAAVVRGMWDAVAGIPPFTLDAMDAEEIAAYIRREQARGAEFRLDFFEWADALLPTLKREPGTIRGYRAALASFRRYRERVDVNEITAAMLEAWLDGAKGVGANTQRAYLSKLAALYGMARRKYNDEDAGVIRIPRDPFARVKVKPEPSHGQRAFTVAEMQALINEGDGLPWAQRRSLDLFLLSFCLMGMNEADLREAPAPKDGWFVYHRKKTRNHRADRAEMHVRVPAEAAPYLRRLGDPTGRMLLRPLAHKSEIWEHLQAYADSRGMERFSMGAARHTWATLARRSGVEKATVDEGLAHKGDFAIADIYIDRDWDIINNANKSVLALFVWPEA